MTMNAIRGLCVAAVVAASALASGCAALFVGGAVVGGAMVVTDRRTSGTQVDDELIELKARSRLSEALGERGSVGATSYNRMVLLVGEVQTESDKLAAEQVIARIENVQSVVNEIRVGPFNSFGEKTRDAFLTTKVKASIVDAKDLLARSINVTTHRSVVYLMGRVSQREADRAAEVARGVSGVAKVVKVFDVVSDSDIAGTARKEVARPAN